MPDAPRIRRALISVYDKTGVGDFARALHDEFGVEISADAAGQLLERVRSTAVELKRPLFDKELMLLYQEVTGEVEEWEDKPW